MSDESSDLVTDLISRLQTQESQMEQKDATITSQSSQIQSLQAQLNELRIQLAKAASPAPSLPTTSSTSSWSAAEVVPPVIVVTESNSKAESAQPAQPLQPAVQISDDRASLAADAAAAIAATLKADDGSLIVTMARSTLQMVAQTEQELDTVMTAQEIKLDAFHEEFEQRGKVLFTEIDAATKPLQDKLTSMRRPLGELLTGRLVDLSAEDVSEYRMRGGRFGAKGSAEKPRFSTAAGRTLGDRDVVSVFNERQSARRFARQRAEREQRQLEQQRRQAEETAQAAARRAAKARDELMPIVPQLTLEQCVRALELNSDSLEQTMQWVFDQSHEQLQRKLVPAEPQASALPPSMSSLMMRLESYEFGSGESMDSEEPEIPTLKLSRSTSSQAGPKRITYRVRAFQASTGIIELLPVLDRNRIPIDSGAHIRALELSLQDLLMQVDESADIHLHLLSAAEIAAVERDCRERVLTVTFQHIEDDEFCPIEIQPPIRLAEYRMDFDQHSRTISGVKHRQDGPVRFNGVLDEGFGLLESASPIEVYTQVLDDSTLNIVHLHINDINDEITFDRVNLTGTDRQLEDMMRQDAFARDASGKMLTYKVVVKDGRVLAVLYLKGGNVERAVFVEHRLPVVGSVVSFPGSAHSSSAASDATRLGVVKQIPLGMAVCVADEGVENSNPCSFPRTEEACLQCTKKHPVELDGGVDVQVVSDGTKFLHPPLSLRLPVCLLRLASEQQLAMLETQHETFEREAASEYESMLARLEIMVNSPVTYDADGKSSVSMTEIEDLRSRMNALPPVSATIEACSARLRRLQGAIRALAVELRKVR